LLVEETLLLLLIGSFLLVFSLPSQRSGRYLLPVMPAFAALIALRRDRLPLWGFRISLVASEPSRVIGMAWNESAGCCIFRGFRSLAISPSAIGFSWG
jgi:hypothetical protein